MHAPTVADAKHVAKTARQVVATKEDGLVFPKLDAESLEAVVAADGSWANAGEKTDGGYLAFLSDGTPPTTNGCGRVVRKGCLTDWRAGAISRVCVGTFDAETLETLTGTDVGILLAYLVDELIRGRLPSLAEQALLRGVGHVQRVPAPGMPVAVLNDGLGTISAIHSTKPIANKRRRVDVALLREAEADLGVRYHHVETTSMQADALTKKVTHDGGALAAAASGKVWWPVPA